MAEHHRLCDPGIAAPCRAEPSAAFRASRRRDPITALSDWRRIVYEVGKVVLMAAIRS